MKDDFQIDKKILLPAIECIGELGCVKATMEDIAQYAGVSRRTVYRECGDKQKLISAIMMYQVGLLGDELQRSMNGSESFAQVMLMMICEGGKWLRENAVVMEILDSSRHLDFTDYLLDPNTEFQRYPARLLDGIIEKGRATGEVTDGLTNAEIVSWVRAGVLLLILNRGVIDIDDRVYAEKFILPALLSR